MYKIIGAILLVTAVLTFGACSKKPAKVARASGETSKPSLDTQTAKYHKITAKEANELLNSDKEIVLLDVRSKAEYDEKHIEGAMLIPDGEIEKRAPAEISDTNATILVYCRSGARSKGAANQLVKMGYTEVYDFGGIIDYPYETVSK